MFDQTYIFNNKGNEDMQRLINWHSLQGIDDRIVFIANKLVKCQTSSYTFKTLFILDDCASSDVLINNNTEFLQLLTKISHYKSSNKLFSIT